MMIPRARQLLSGAAGGVFAVSVVNQLLVLAILMTLSRVMSVAEFGLVSIAMAIMTIAAVPFRGGMALYATQQAASRETSFVAGLIRHWRWFMPTVAALIGVFLFLFFYATDQSMAGLMILAPFYLAGVASLMLSGAIQRGLMRIVTGRIMELIIQPAILIAALCAVYFMNVSLSALDAFALQTVTMLAAAFIAYTMMHRVAPMREEPVYHRKEWLFGAMPMIAGVGLITLNAMIDVVMVGYWLGEEAAGPYRLAAHLSTFLTFILAVSNNATQAPVAKLYADRKLDELQVLLNRTSRGTFALSIFPALIMMIFPVTVLSILFGEAYAIAAVSLSILAAAALFNIAAGQAAQLMLLTGHGREVSAAVIVGILANIALNCLLVPRIGMAGAAIATSLSIVLWKGWMVYRVDALTGLNSCIFPWRKASHRSREIVNETSERIIPSQQ